jgi:glutaredoxin 3
MKNTSISVYTISNCPYCNRAKNLLSSRNIPFEEIHVSKEDTKTVDELFAKSGMKSFPQIFNGPTLIGGYTELAQLDEKTKLQGIG